MKIKCYGIGSPQYEDQIGWKIVERLKELELNQEIDYVILDRPGMRLIDEFYGYDLCVLFDAVIGVDAGEIVELEDLTIYAQQNLLSSHGFGVAEAVKLAEVLNRLPPKLLFYGVGAGNTRLINQGIESVIQLFLRRIDELV
jgi:hydrogenase maturation protease